MKKKRIMISLTFILLIAVTVMCGSSFYKMKLVSKEVTVELGDKLNNSVSSYVSGNIKNAALNLSDVDINSIGTYMAKVINTKQILVFTVKVVDTTPPKATAADNKSFPVNEKVYADQLVTDVQDKSNVTITFTDNSLYKVYHDDGTHTEAILLKDMAGNKTTVQVNFSIVSDKDKPKISGIRDIKIYEGDKINYLSGVTAVDEKDGDVTSCMKVNSSNVNINVPGKYKVIYSASDKSGNIATKKSTVTILRDKAPEILGTADKTIYINNSINYLKGVTAKDEKDGNLTKHIKLDNSQVIISRAGKYIATYAVTDSGGNKTLKSINVTVNSKNPKARFVSKEANDVKTNNHSSNSKKTMVNKNKDKRSNKGFQFFDVKPSGKQPNGHVDPGGKQNVGTW